MAVRKSRLRSSPARKMRRPAPARSSTSYRQVRAAIALALFILVFCGLWMINGELTARYVVGRFGQSATTGWAVHLLITAIEIAPAVLAPWLEDVPKKVLVVLWAMSLPFGVFDALSSAVGLQPYLLWTSLEGVAQHIQNTIAAEIIGFLPEQMILWLLVALGRVLRGTKV